MVLRGEWRELGAGFLAGDLCGRTETVSFISPCYRGEGAGRGRPRKFSPSQDEKQDEHHQQDDEEDNNCTPLPSIWKEKEASAFML